MSNADGLLYSALHGTAVRYAAEQGDPTASIAELREIADGRDHVLAEAAGITAGSWYASPAIHVGHELIAAGMLILAGGGRGVPLNYGELERWTRVGFERGTKARQNADACHRDDMPARAAGVSARSSRHTSDFLTIPRQRRIRTWPGRRGVDLRGLRWSGCFLRLARGQAPTADQRS